MATVLAFVMQDTVSTNSHADLIKALLSRNESIAAALQKSQPIDDVLCDRILTRQKSATAYAATGADVAFGSPMPGEIHYLPRGKLENQSEYTQRIGMTPFFPKTPGILNDRQGALFSNPPRLEGSNADRFKDFEKSATSDGQSLLTSIITASALIQRHGFCGVFVDRSPLPDDIRARMESDNDNDKPSAFEVSQRKIGAPQLVVYRADQILDFDRDGQGLKWVKVIETTSARGGWNEKPVLVQTVRIFDRVNIVSYRIETRDGKSVLTKGPIQTAHGFGSIPFVIAAPFAGDDGIGRPSLHGCAMADIAATRILSDLIWSLFVLGNPILTFSTNRDDEDLKKMAVGATRYIPLMNGRGSEEPESLSFVQLDATGLEMLVAMHERFLMEAESQAGKDAPGATTQPLNEQSGISRAWQFKTGQERILFLITRELQKCFDSVLDLVAQALGVDPETISIKFAESFDMGSTKETIGNSKQILELVEKYQLKKSIGLALKRAIFAAFGGMSDETTAEINAEIDAQIEAIAGETEDDTSQTTKPSEEDASGEPAEIVKIPLALQQLALARQRFIETGDTARAERVAKKMDQLLAVISAAA